MVVVKSDRATSGTTTAPTGWTRIASAAAVSNYRVEMFWGVYGYNSIGAGPWSFTGTTRTEVLCVTYYGVNTGVPITGTPTARSNASGTTGTTSITPAVNNNMIVGGFTAPNTVYTFSSETTATFGALSEAYEAAYSTYANIAIADNIQASAGATGESSATMSTNAVNGGCLAALAPGVYYDHIGGIYETATFKADVSVERVKVGTVYATETVAAKYGGNVMLAESANIASGGANTTTYQLTAPSGKATTDFVAGRIADDTNPLTVDISTNDYTELEWCVTVNGATNDIYDLRVTANGTPLDTYTLTPQYTIGASGVNYAYQGAVASTQYAASSRTIEKIADAWDYSTGFAVATRTVDINKVIGVTSERWVSAGRTIEKVVPGNVYATDTWAATVSGILNYIYQGTLFSTQYQTHGRTIERMLYGMQYETGFQTHVRNVEKVNEGAIRSTGYQTHQKTIERMLYGTQYATETWAATISAGLKDFLFAGTISATDYWIAQRLIEKIITGAVYSTDTWGAEKYYERTAVQGAVFSTDSWSSVKTAEALKVGSVYSTQYQKHYRTIEKIIDDIIAGNFSWVAYFEGNILNFIHEGLVQSDQTWLYPFIVSKIFTGSVLAEETWSTERWSDYLWSGAVFGNGYHTHLRNIERVIPGSVYSTQDWKHIIGRQMVFIGNVNGQDYWVSQKSFQKVLTGTIKAEEFWSHIVTKHSWSMPSDIYVVQTRPGPAIVSGRIGDAEVPSRIADAIVASRIGNATYEGS
jgi:hypothetical protein